MSASSSPSPGQNRLHRRYLAVLPRIVRHARCYFRWLKCWDTREDKIQEVRCLTWKWIKQLHKRGKAWWLYVSRIADYACRQVKSGRKIAGNIRIRDIMNESNQARKGYYVGKLPDFSTESSNPLVEALTDNTQTPVDEAVAFRIDFPAWMSEHSDRDRALLTDMAMGHRTKDLAHRYQISEGRVSQKRREFHESWCRYTDA